MALLDFFRKKTPPKQSVPGPIALDAMPITLNATAKQKAIRHANRVHTLMLAIEQAPASLGPGTTVESLKEELKRRHGALIAHGHEPPQTKEDAMELAERIGRGGK